METTNMYEYEIRYIDMEGNEQCMLRESEGIAECIDTFIETFCPVRHIESVTKVSDYLPQNRESRPA